MFSFNRDFLYNNTVFALIKFMFCIYIARYSILVASLLRSIIPGKPKRASSQFESGHGLLCLSVTLADLFSIKSFSLFNYSCVRVEGQNCHPILKSAFKRFWIYSVFIVFAFLTETGAQQLSITLILLFIYIYEEFIGYFKLS